MKKPGAVVLKETKYIALVVLSLSFVMQIVFAVLSAWDYKVLLGNILSAALSITNFLFMGITVEKAVLCDEKEARTIIRNSQTLRQIMLFAVTAAGVLLPCFNTFSVIIPLIFPRIAISLKPLFGKNK